MASVESPEGPAISHEACKDGARFTGHIPILYVKLSQLCCSWTGGSRTKMAATHGRSFYGESQSGDVRGSRVFLGPWPHRLWRQLENQFCSNTFNSRWFHRRSDRTACPVSAGGLS